MIETTVKPASILCVGNRWFPKAPGGAERYVYELIHQLAAEGDRVELCAADLPASSSQDLLYLTNLTSTQRSLPQRLWTSRSQFQHRHLSIPDAINLHFALYSFPLLSSLPKHVSVIFTFHGPWAGESKQEGQSSWGTAFKYWMEQQVYQRCDRFIVLSKAFGKILHQDYDISWERIHVIPGGVDTQHFQPSLTRQQAREKLHWSPDRFILFTPRRLVHRMGLDKLLLALAQVKQAYPDVYLAIAGKGPLKADLEQQTKELELQNHVQFLGFLPDADLPIAYQAADLTIMPSQSLEGFGLVLVESLACGTPVVCTPVGGMPEVIGGFSPHLITQTSQADSIAQTLTDILAGQIALPTREACRDYAKQRFDWTAIAQQVRQVLLA